MSGNQVRDLIAELSRFDSRDEVRIIVQSISALHACAMADEENSVELEPLEVTREHGIVLIHATL